mmetsp:Transcript_4413/g.11271  ORF Transcript_4413/g.11271 Transcript_4413/m.11271 type:complete len:224 (+) Transcript_4413:180-851(+)
MHRVETNPLLGRPRRRGRAQLVPLELAHPLLDTPLAPNVSHVQPRFDLPKVPPLAVARGQLLLPHLGEDVRAVRRALDRLCRGARPRVEQPLPWRRRGLGPVVAHLPRHGPEGGCAGRVPRRRGLAVLPVAQRAPRREARRDEHRTAHLALRRRARQSGPRGRPWAAGRRWRRDAQLLRRREVRRSRALARALGGRGGRRALERRVPARRRQWPLLARVRLRE